MIDAEDLKIKVKERAHAYNLEPQDIMQMYFFERLLYRISISEYFKRWSSFISNIW